MDPFDDIDGIVQVREEEVPANESAMFRREQTSEQQYIDSFPAALRAKVAADRAAREKMEQHIFEARQELHNVREKLYEARFKNPADSRDAILKNVENCLSEIDRLENKITKLRERQLETFVKQLELEDLNVSSNRLTRHMKRNRSMVPGSARTENTHMDRLLSEGALKPQTGLLVPKSTKFGRLLSREQLERTVSPPSTSGGGYEPRETQAPVADDAPLIKRSDSPTPRDRWTNLMKRYKEWKTTEDGKVQARNQKELAKEIADLRGQIYAISQKKELTLKDEENIRIMTAKLRALKEL